MKPLNRDEPGCNYTTSNCVIWQGPDLPCINLCKGDTVSDVIFKLATQLCDVLDILDIKSYDLSCFNLTSCKPDDFKQLIQFLINRICLLEQCTGCIPDCNGDSTLPVPPGDNNGCPDCLVPIAPCFYFIDPKTGDQITSLQLLDYVTLIGNTLCSIVGTAGIQQQTINNHGQRIGVLEEQVNNPVPPVTNQIVPVCVLPQQLTDVDLVLAALEAQFCELRSATGDPTALYNNIAKQCIGLTEQEALNGSGVTMGALQGWSPVVNNLAQAIGNMWLTVCDMRQAVKNIQLTCCPTACEGIVLNLFASLAGDIITVFPTGTIPAGFLQCSGSTQVVITDSQGGSATFTMNLIGFLNNPTGVSFSLVGTPINVSLDLTVVIQPCLTNQSENSTCQSYLSYKVVNSANCPAVNYQTNQGTIFYDFISSVGNFTYNVQLWDAMGATMISNQILVISGPSPVAGQFIGLAPGTLYKVRLSIQATSCPSCEPVDCPFTNVTTNPPTCPAPEAVSAGIT